jgi:hypothetical protein
LEERISLLEERATAFDKKLRRITDGVDEVPPAPPPPPPTDWLQLKPELKFQLFRDLDRLGTAIQPATHQINVFIGEPKAQKIGKFRRRKIESEAFEDDSMGNQIVSSDPKLAQFSDSSDERRLIEEMAKVKSKHFPNRIRLNEPAIYHLFRKYLAYNDVDDIIDNVVLRPFKPLLHNKEEIRNIMLDVVASFTTIIEQRAYKDAGAIKDPGELDNETTTHQSQEAIEVTDMPPKKSCNAIPNNESSAPNAITADEWDTVLKQLELFQETSCCGRNMSAWSTLTEVKKSFPCINDLLDNYLLPGHRLANGLGLGWICQTPTHKFNANDGLRLG